MAKSQKDIRHLLNLLALLNQRKGERAEAVARELGISQKRLLGELDRLCLCGAPPYGPSDLFMAVVDEEGRLDVAFADQFQSPPPLTPKEAMALRTAIMPLLERRDQPFARLAQGLLEKLDQALLPQDRKTVDRLQRSLVMSSKEEGAASILEDLRLARNSRKSVEMVYFTGSSEQIKQRRVDPYGFVFYAGSWYLVAFCHTAQEIRVFKISRIRDLHTTERTYHIPDDFDISQYARRELFSPAGGEQTVKIWFSPRVARWVLEENRQARRQRDGSALLTLRASSLAWIARWILPYGEEAKVLEPPQARAEVLKILERRKGL